MAARDQINLAVCFPARFVQQIFPGMLHAGQLRLACGSHVDRQSIPHRVVTQGMPLDGLQLDGLQLELCELAGLRAQASVVHRFS